MCQINFVAEFRAIMEACRRDSVPGRTRLLWIALFYLANDRAQEDGQTGAWEWPDEFFPVNNAELATHCPLEKRALLEARNRLKQMGVIDFKPGDNALKPAKYRMRYLTGGQRCKNAPQEVPQEVPQHAPQEVPQHAPQGAPQHAPQGAPYYININRDTGVNPKGYLDDDEDDDDDTIARAREEDEPADNRENRTAAIRAAFFSAFGRMPLPAEVKRLAIMSRSMRMGADMVALALARAAGKGAQSPVDYCAEILAEWRENEVFRPEQVEEYLVEFMKYNGKGGLYGSGDPAVDYQEQQEARERRRRENLEAGFG